MKTVFILLATFAVYSASAQPATNEEALDSQLITRLSKASSLMRYDAKPNEVVSGHVTYSGIAVELLKSHNPLQLVNPLAPASYGSADDNVLRDSVSGRASAWKIFSIGF